MKLEYFGKEKHKKPACNGRFCAIAEGGAPPTPQLRKAARPLHAGTDSESR